MISRIFKNSIVSVLIVTFLVPVGLFLYPYKADAGTGTCAAIVAGAIASVTGASVAAAVTGVPVADQGTQAGSAIQAGSGYGSFFKDCVLIPIATRLAKAMLKNITSSIVDWINRGFEGKPSFIQDLKGLTDDTIDQVVGDYIQNELGGGILCQPFSFQVKIAIAQSYLPYRQRSSCTLTQIKNNASGLVNGTNGGWDNWLQITTEPQNNVWGATILAQDAISAAVAEKLTLQNRKLDWSKGFRDQEICAEAKDEDGKTISPNGIKITDPRCKRTRTSTPGTVIEGQLQTALGSGIHQLELAEDIDAILGALTNQLMSQVITGAQGLLGAGRNSNGSYQPTTYTQALGGTVTDPALNQAIQEGIDTTTSDAGLDDIFTNTTNTIVSSPVPTPVPTEDETGSSEPVFTFRVTKTTVPVTQYVPLSYALDLSTDKSVTGLTIRTTLKRGSGSSAIPVAFLSPFVSFKIQKTANGITVPRDVETFDKTSEEWENVSMSAGGKFSLTFIGFRRNSVGLGPYTIETTVSDAMGQVLQTEETVFTMQ